MRVWLVTALDRDGNFVEQRRIEAKSLNMAESYAYTWIRHVGGDMLKSKIEELT